MVLLDPAQVVSKKLAHFLDQKLWGLRRSLMGVVVVLAAVVAISFYIAQDHVVKDSNPRLKPFGYQRHFEGKPFTGVSYSLHTNGKLRRIMMFWQGRKVATERIWYDNGQLMVERPYREGKAHGSWKQWYDNGAVKSFKNYRHGVIDGEVWAWHANGQLSDFNLYDNGREIAHKSWIADGKPFYNYVYQDGHKIGIKGGDYCKRLDKIR